MAPDHAETKVLMPARSPEMSRYTETERKFDVDEATVSPSQTLDAVYYDTSAHDLARHRITLRRRTGGTDAGWHLKLPAGQDSRPGFEEKIKKGMKPG